MPPTSSPAPLPRRAGRARVHAGIPCARRGFTLAELTVAIMLLTVGVGALASTAAFVLYETAASRRAEAASQIARTRFALLRLAPCVPAAGVEVHGGLTERWSLALAPHGASVAVAITWQDRGEPMLQRYRTAFPC